jgi:hypothetical protein
MSGVELIKISEDDLKLLLKGKNGDYTIHVNLDHGGSVHIEKGKDISVLEEI